MSIIIKETLARWNVCFVSFTHARRRHVGQSLWRSWEPSRCDQGVIRGQSSHRCKGDPNSANMNQGCLRRLKEVKTKRSWGVSHFVHYWREQIHFQNSFFCKMLILYFGFLSVFREEFTFSIPSIITVEPEFVRTFWQSVQLWQWAGFLVGVICLIEFTMQSWGERTWSRLMLMNILFFCQGLTISSTSISDRGRLCSSNSTGNSSLLRCLWSVWNRFHQGSFISWEVEFTLLAHITEHDASLHNQRPQSLASSLQ